MKDTGDLFSKICDMDNLRKAHKNAKRGNVEYMHNYYLKEVKGNAEICKRKNYSGERKAS